MNTPLHLPRSRATLDPTTAATTDAAEAAKLTQALENIEVTSREQAQIATLALAAHRIEPLLPNERQLLVEALQKQHAIQLAALGIIAP
jgi:N-dimethylarginine dimethylaminohydrolase